MDMTIKSKDGTRYSFWAPRQGNSEFGYVRVQINCGQMRQICEGGGFEGITVMSTVNTFERDCRRWYRQRKAR